VIANTRDMWNRDTQVASAISSSVNSRPKWLSINYGARSTGVALAISICLNLITTKPRYPNRSVSRLIAVAILCRLQNGKRREASG
jgi:hypothetical protein